MEHAQRREFVELTMEQQKMDTDFSNKIIFNDEAYFHGFVNRQNYRIWGLSKSISDC